jgi:hypothetical protein
VLYVNGSPIFGTSHGLRVGPEAVRFFKDNVRGGAGDEEAGGALACVLVYDGALSAGEVRQQAADPALCPAPKPVPPPALPFRTGVYRGTTSQGLPIFLGEAAIRDRRFSVRGLLATGGRARVSGRLRGSHARGTLSRWANSAFNTVCVARGVTWRAHLVGHARA